MQRHLKPRRTVGWVGPAACVLLLGLGAEALPARAACSVQQMDIPVRTVERRPVATMVLNGTPVQLLVDSGAFYSMLTPSTAAQLKLPLRHLPFGMSVRGYTGEIEAKRTVVEEVGLAPAKLKDIEFLVGGNELGAGIQGILGRNILSLADTEYDLAHGMVRLSFPKGDCEDSNLAHWAGEAPVVVVPLVRNERTDTSIRVNIAINGRTTIALLDTGATRTTMTLRAAQRAGIEERDMTHAGRVGGAGEGAVRAWTAPVATFELGGERILDSRLGVAAASTTNHDMLLGLDYFLSHRIYVSRLQRKLYVTWNGQPIFPPASAAAVAASGTADSPYAAKPQDLSPDDADGLARRGTAALAAGDTVRALADLTRAVELAPTVAQHVQDRARVHLAMRQPRLALADLDEALRLEPGLAEARARRSRLRVELRDRAGAEADLAQLDAALPPSSHLRADMGRLYFNLGQMELALKQFDQWVSTHPDDAALAGVLSTRCWLRARQNIELPRALQDCKKAVDLDGGDPVQHTNLGLTYLRMAEPGSARKSFDRAVALRPLPQALYGRALAQLRLDEATGAERDLAAARAARPQIDDEMRRMGFEPAPGGPAPKAQP